MSGVVGADKPYPGKVNVRARTVRPDEYLAARQES